jgi:hypothetical protein
MKQQKWFITAFLYAIDEYGLRCGRCTVDVPVDLSGSIPTVPCVVRLGKLTFVRTNTCPLIYESVAIATIKKVVRDWRPL